MKLLKGKRLAPVLYLGNQPSGQLDGALFQVLVNISQVYLVDWSGNVAACSVIALINAVNLTEVRNVGLWAGHVCSWEETIGCQFTESLWRFSWSGCGHINVKDVD